MARSRRRLRVAHLVNSLRMGGLENVVYQLVRHADRDRFEPCVVCLDEEGYYADFIREAHVEVQSLSAAGIGSLRRAVLLRGLFRNLKPDVVHTHNPGPQLPGALAARWADVRALIHTKHGRNPTNSTWRSWAARWASRQADRVVAISQDTADVAKSVDHVPDRRLEVIPNGVDLDQFSPSRTLEHRPPTAIHVARLDLPIKDQWTLLAATRRVADERPDFRLLIVGDGPDRNAIEREIERLFLGEQVRVLGQRGDVPQLLARSDMLVLSSLTEGLSMTLLEGAAAGLPLIATHVGGNPEVVHDGHNGILVPPRDPPALAQAILRLVTNPSLQSSMGLRSRALAEERFSARRMVSAYESLYESVLASRAAG